MNTTAPLRNTQRRLTEAQKRAIVAAVATGESQKQVAARFKCHPNTVSNLCRDVVKVPGSPLSPDWRKELSEDVPGLAVTALKRSLNDTEDVHKAGSNGIAALKGLGHLAGDGANITINQLIASIPDDLRDRYIGTPEVVDSTGESTNDSISRTDTAT